eukprot:3483696-Lingulodinium_polyedra.AAC.1
MGRKIHQHHSLYYRMQASTSAVASVHLELLEDLDWVVTTGCCCHDVHNSLKWAVSEVVKTPTTLKDIFMIIRSAREGYDLIQKTLPSFLLKNLSFDDSPHDPTQVIRFWSFLGVDYETAELLGTLNL